MGTLVIANKIKVGVTILQNNLAVRSEINDYTHNPTTQQSCNMIYIAEKLSCEFTSRAARESSLQQYLWRQRARNQLIAPHRESG